MTPKTKLNLKRIPQVILIRFPLMVLSALMLSIGHLGSIIEDCVDSKVDGLERWW
jgi:hypothetical protein